MIQHLSSLATDRVLLSFAPKTCVYATLKKVGDFFSWAKQGHSGLLAPGVGRSEGAGG